MIPLISVCIPAYKNVHYLSRLLQSIDQQSFKDFEVVITDDSDDLSVQDHILQNNYSFVINYIKNQPALGMPANWNFCLSNAKGEWIKIMHDDDWFSTSESLNDFAKYTSSNKRFIFSAYTNVYEIQNKHHPVFLSNSWKSRLVKHPSALYASNVIGPPSVTLVHKSILTKYDLNLKWRVDIDYYIKLLQSDKAFHYIRNPLVNIGLSEEQVTISCFNNPEVEIPETLYMMQKFGTGIFNNMWAYDGLWRMLRNLKIYDMETFIRYKKNYQVPDMVKRIITHINKTKKSWLGYGVYSKCMMLLSYLKNK